MKVTNKVFVVTGGGNGIGRELVLQLLAKGARVAAVDIDETKLKETVALAGGNAKISTHVVNVADRTAVEKLPAAVIKGARGCGWPDQQCRHHPEIRKGQRPRIQGYRARPKCQSIWRDPHDQGFPATSA